MMGCKQTRPGRTACDAVPRFAARLSEPSFDKGGRASYHARDGLVSANTGCKFDNSWNS